MHLHVKLSLILGLPPTRYLHEQCQPPVIHRNFKSANILLDEDLSVRVSDCGLAPLITKGAVRQVRFYKTMFGNCTICFKLNSTALLFNE